MVKIEVNSFDYLQNRTDPAKGYEGDKKLCEATIFYMLRDDHHGAVYDWLYTKSEQKIDRSFLPVFHRRHALLLRRKFHAKLYRSFVSVVSDKSLDSNYTNVNR